MWKSSLHTIQNMKYELSFKTVKNLTYFLTPVGLMIFFDKLDSWFRTWFLTPIDLTNFLDNFQLWILNVFLDILQSSKIFFFHLNLHKYWIFCEIVWLKSRTKSSNLMHYDWCKWIDVIVYTFILVAKETTTLHEPSVFQIKAKWKAWKNN